MFSLPTNKFPLLLVMIKTYTKKRFGAKGIYTFKYTYPKPL